MNKLGSRITGAPTYSFFCHRHTDKDAVKSAFGALRLLKDEKHGLVNISSDGLRSEMVWDHYPQNPHSLSMRPGSQHSASCRVP